MSLLVDSVCQALFYHLQSQKGRIPSEVCYPSPGVNSANELKVVHSLIRESGLFDYQDSPFGFHVNEFGEREDRKIVFSSVTAGSEGSGPSTSLHQFYSVAEAKDLVHQLLIAIAKAEATINDLPE